LATAASIASIRVRLPGKSRVSMMVSDGAWCGLS
jgi:hypothetical protein